MWRIELLVKGRPAGSSPAAEVHLRQHKMCGSSSGSQLQTLAPEQGFTTERDGVQQVV